ncbi:transposase family protein [Pseudonocardia nigra]|uniref:transposase family protein n=1 Tax=Pseudonocardia nigra TaxID=1921578 RepID=UPI001C5DD6DD|nr:transposase family protein [Pseudonocardia nigra]
MERVDHHDHHPAPPATTGSRAGQTTRPPSPKNPPRPRTSPLLTLADRLLATVLHQRHALPQVAVAALFNVRPETINRRIRDTRDLLDQAGHTIEHTDQPLATLDELYELAGTAGITIPTRITTAS